MPVLLFWSPETNKYFLKFVNNILTLTPFCIVKGENNLIKHWQNLIIDNRIIEKYTGM